MLPSAINNHYKTHDASKISQGDILRDFEFIIGGKGRNAVQIEFQYVVVLNQDCDLSWGSHFFDRDTTQPFNQYLHNILLTPAFPAGLARSGEHLSKLFGFKSCRITSANWKLIKQNRNPRYHYLPADIDLQIPDLLIDFKAYYTIPYEYILELYSDSYQTTINELFRDALGQRFAHFFTRIALPEIKK